MTRKIHNKDTMSTNDKTAYAKLKELLQFADGSIADYCKRKKITTSTIANKIYRGTLLLYEVLEIAKEYNIVIRIIKDDKNNRLERILSSTLTFKDTILLLEQLGYKIEFSID